MKMREIRARSTMTDKFDKFRHFGADDDWFGKIAISSISLKITTMPVSQPPQVTFDGGAQNQIHSFADGAKKYGFDSIMIGGHSFSRRKMH